MNTVASLLVLLGVAILALASDVIDAFLIAGLFSRACRRVAPPWMHRGVIAMVLGSALIVTGMALLHVST